MKLKFLALTILSVCFMVSCSSDSKTYVTIETEFGNMKVELYDSTPKHKENFIKLVKEGFYKDLLFHRVIPQFMIQGGDPNSRGAAMGVPLGSGGPNYKLDAEIGAPHFKGTLAAARQGGAINPKKQSSGSQFYLVQGKIQTDQELDGYERRGNFKYNQEQRNKYKTIGGTPALDNDYTVFGEVVEGLDVIDKIAGVKTNESDRPYDDVKMNIVR
jgi:peptidyl-prolyl cis-trans isomerase B (cyclophilin B)